MGRNVDRLIRTACRTQPYYKLFSRHPARLVLNRAKADLVSFSRVQKTTQGKHPVAKQACLVVNVCYSAHALLWRLLGVLLRQFNWP